MDSDIYKKIAEAKQHSIDAPVLFLESWKSGVEVLGIHFFKVERGFEDIKDPKEATEKDQLCPDYEYIKINIGVLSGGERVLLAAMCSIYNSEWGGDLLREQGVNGLADIGAKLDYREKRIISDILANYCGW